MNDIGSSAYLNLPGSRHYNLGGARHLLSFHSLSKCVCRQQGYLKSFFGLGTKPKTIVNSWCYLKDDKKESYYPNEKYL